MEMDIDAAVPEEPEDTASSEDELALARELVLRAHPATVPELVSGSSLAELLASVPAAEAAYARIAATAREATQPGVATVPAGGVVRSASINVDGLSPLAKIRTGLNRS